ncbi:hypothetical protein GCM10009665_59410 [Kitasatospora nipponensis]|uniref:Protein kinase domain-containing protein n=1 Tax=Kitasatospora nipponensis TaxID=258049 RepID=A0ABN1WUS2_9ACTN
MGTPPRGGSGPDAEQTTVADDTPKSATPGPATARPATARPLPASPDRARPDGAGPHGAPRDPWGADDRCPPWVVDPVEGRGSAAAPRGRGVPDLLAGRYALTAAVQQDAGGGVFLGTDTVTGAAVVVKQACAPRGPDRAGTDARDALRREAGLLAELAPAGLSVPPIALIERQDSLLLVREHLAGQCLDSWVAARLTGDGAPDVPWAAAGPLALALVELLAAVPATGLVLRDLAPGGVLVRPDGALLLVNLEPARPAGTVATTAGTPGYRAPELAPGPVELLAPVGPADTDVNAGADAVTDSDADGCGPMAAVARAAAAIPGCGSRAATPRGGRRGDPRPDLFALGGLLFLLATGHDPLLPEDLPGARPVPERLGRWLALAAREGATARRLAPLILGLRAERPDERWSLARVRAALTALDRAPDTPSAPSAPTAEPADPAPPTAHHPTTAHHFDRRPLERVLLDGLRHLTDTATPQRPDRLWPAVPAGQHTDPCNVQHGAAGVLAVLARALSAPEVAGELRERLQLTARQAAGWIERRSAAEAMVLPGLHFGRSGPVWALLDAAEALGDPALARRARRLATRIPTRWPRPGVCHGAAGAGFLRLRLGEPAGALESARALLAAAEQAPYGTVWPAPADVEGGPGVVAHLGYGHGVAGVGAFLLAAFSATGDPELLDGARRAARTLAATVRPGAGPGPAAGPTPDAAWWPQSADDPPAVRLAHWCSGSSGVGSFLVRLWQVTGEPATRALAVAAGQAVLDSRWHSGTSACHGLAGDGEYLLDLAAATGEERFAAGAREVAQLISARAALRDGLLVLPDETGFGCAAAFGTGTAGALAFLLRLRHGGPRLWLDPVPRGRGRR